MNDAEPKEAHDDPAFRRSTGSACDVKWPRFDARRTYLRRTVAYLAGEIWQNSSGLVNRRSDYHRLCHRSLLATAMANGVRETLYAGDTACPVCFEYARILQEANKSRFT